MEAQTLPMSLSHSDGYREVDWHQSFGSMEEASTRTWFNTKGKRGLIIGRSTLAGVGKYASKWLGDNYSGAVSMGYSIYGVLSMSQFGIPMVGADICGFMGDTTPELCAKWHLVGATYPFSRNHNGYDNRPQEPYQFKNDMFNQTTSYMQIMKFGIQTKYALLNYYYSQYADVAANGGALMQPLYFQFKDDAEAWRDINFNYMIGDSLKVAMVTNSTTMPQSDFYFPAGTWCELLNRGACITGPAYQRFNTKDISQNLMYVPSSKILLVNFWAYSATTFDLDSLRKQPSDILVNGIADKGKTTWTAALSKPFVADDQAVTAPKVNSYAITANADLTTNTITVKVVATGANGTGVTNCAGVFSFNELLQKITLMNIVGLDAKKTYQATTTAGQVLKARIANGNLEVNFDRSKSLCMQTVDTITIAPTA